jgi:hypothetical protein
MRRLAPRVCDAEVHARLSEANGVELRVAVGDVQQRDIAKRGDAAIEPFAVGIVSGERLCERQSGDRGGSQALQEFAAPHLIVGRLRKAARREPTTITD